MMIELESCTDQLNEELHRAGFSSKSLYNANRWNLTNLYSFGDDMLCYRSYYGKLYPGLTQDLMDKLFALMGLRSAVDMLETESARVRSEPLARSFIKGMEDLI